MFKKISIKKNSTLCIFVVSLSVSQFAIAQGNYYQNQGYSDQNQGYSDQNQGYQYQNQGYPNQNRGYSNQDYSDQNMSYPNQNSVYSNDNYGNRNTNDRYDQRNPGVSDQDLGRKIRDKIGSGWFSRGYDKVVVRVNNGTVTLEGIVKTWGDKEKVEKEVRNIEGVKSVNSQISVEDINSKDKEQKQYPQDIYATSADEQLNKKIRDNTSRGWLWNSYKNVVLNTSNGVVTLEGNVDSASDKQKLVNEIQKIEGVKAVKDSLRVRNK
jgi:osmotically-inducible protein OsmY